jgi:RNA recognition motif-containing protein
VSGLEECTDENALRKLFGAAVVDVRLARDRFLGTLRGFGFVEFGTITDAARALHALQVHANIRMSHACVHLPLLAHVCVCL